MNIGQRFTTFHVIVEAQHRDLARHESITYSRDNDAPDKKKSRFEPTNSPMEKNQLRVSPLNTGL